MTTTGSKSTQVSKDDRAKIDLDAQVAQISEARSEGFLITYRGETYEVDPFLEWDPDVLMHVQNANFQEASRLLLGDEQYETFRSTKPKPKVKDYMALFGAVGKKAGIGDLADFLG